MHTHGFSGILLVLSVKFILHTSITSSLDSVTYITQIISFSLISLMGVAIVTKNLHNWFKKESTETRTKAWLFASPFTTAFAVGLIPWRGVVMVMLFAISLLSLL